MYRIQAIVLFLIGLLPLAASEVHQLGVIDVRSDQAVPISITSSNERIGLLSQHAFTFHGGFVLMESGGAFTLKIEPQGQTNVYLSILSGNPAETLFEKNVAGTDLDHAALRACDLAVEKITTEPGFFAGKIAFVSDQGGSREIYRSDLFFQQIRRVTNFGDVVVTPQWSPDGSRIAFSSYHKSGTLDLFEADLNRGVIRTLAEYQDKNTGGVYSPYGRHIAMILSSPGNPELYVARADGSSPKRLTNNRSIEDSPTWSQDGRSLIVESSQRGSPQLYLISASGGAMRHLSTGGLSTYCTQPDWNHYDPNQLVFTVRIGRYFQLALMDLASGTSEPLTQGGADSMEAVWTRDGRHLIFTFRNGSRSQLHLMDTKTGKIKALNDGSFGNTFQADYVYP